MDAIRCKGHRKVVHARIQKVLSEVSNFNTFILVDEGRENRNTTLSGHHRPTSEMPFNVLAQHEMLAW